MLETHIYAMSAGILIYAAIAFGMVFIERVVKKEIRRLKKNRKFSF